MSLRITGAGLQTTVQDLGRPAGQRAAIPAGGAMDRLACRAANLLAGNDERCAALEATLLGPTITFERSTVFALGGADLGASIGGQSIPVWRAVRVAAGATLKFGQPARGCRAYIAVSGGIDVPPVFDSRSTYLRGGFGGLEGRALRAGDVLTMGPPSLLAQRIAASLGDEQTAVSVATWSLGVTVRPPYADDVVVRVIGGAHGHLLTEQSRESLFSARYRVSSSSDRMGYRLEGTALVLREPTELLSEGVAFGTVQLPPGGSPIILMADRQTTGGYPRIGEVASVDLPLIAQLKPGDTLRFRPITVADAQRLYLELETELALMRAGLRLRFSSGKTT